LLILAFHLINKSPIINQQSTIPCPYPGPRSFNEDESLFFKGRDQYLDEITKKLEEHHFLLVTGASGDGKSSLIFAGLIPHARAGFFKAKFTRWVVADFRPKRNPLANLIASIARHLEYDDPQKVEKELRQGYSPLVDLYKKSKLYSTEDKKGANLIILVDQFEEFFTNEENYTLETATAKPAAQMVVQFLLETARTAQKEKLPIYVVCTMRSDYFGHCTAFSGLPKMIVKSQFYLERLTRQEILEAIKEPAILSGNEISERLLQVLMNEITDDVGVDMLPILQHCLYQVWRAAGKGKEEMDLLHYAKVGGFPKDQLQNGERDQFEAWFESLPERAKKNYQNPSLRNVLDIHANRLYDTAHEYYNTNNPDKNPISKQESRKIIKIAFQCLTKIDENRSVRNLMSLQEIANIIEESDYDKVAKVLEIFRIEGNTFLRPFVTKDAGMQGLVPETILDITHEALMRNWNRLGKWALEEHERVIIYRDLQTQLEKWLQNKKGKEYLLTAGSLNYFDKWYSELDVNPGAWLGRYMYSEKEIDREDAAQRKKIISEANGHYRDIQEYLKISRNHINKKKRLTRAALITISLLFVISSVSLVINKQLQKTIEITAKSNEIATKASMALEYDPTLSFRLAEQAYNIYPTDLSRQILMSSYTKTPFYNLIKDPNSYISKAKFSPNGKYIITETNDKSFRVWDIRGKLFLTNKKRARIVFDDDFVKFSPNGNDIIAAYPDSTAVLLNLDGKELTIFKGHNGLINSICFSSDGNLILTSSEDSTARIWGVQGKLLKIIKGHFNKVRIAKFSPDGKLILTASNDNTVRVWDLKGNQKAVVKNLRFGLKYNANFSPEGKYIIITSYDNQPRLWDFQKGDLIFLKGHSDVIWSAYFSPDGKHILTSSIDKTARIWDVNGKQLHILEGHTAKLWEAKYSPDGNKIVTVSDDGTARLWDFKGNLLQILKGHASQIFDANFSADGNYLVTCALDNTARIWNLKPDENPILIGHYSWVVDANFSPDGKSLITTGYDYVARIWNIKGYPIQILKGHEHYAVFKGIFSTNGKYLVTAAGDYTARLWNLKGQQITIFRENKDRVFSVELSLDGKYILTSAYDNSGFNTRLWSIKGNMLKDFHNTEFSHFSPVETIFIAKYSDSIACIYEISGKEDFNAVKLVQLLEENSSSIKNAKFSPDGNSIVIINENSTLSLWERNFNKNGKFKFYKILKGHTGPIQSLTFSNNKYFVTTSADKSAVVWNFNGELVQILKGHTDLVTDAAFSPDGKYIATASYDFTVRLWDIKGNELQVYPGHSAAVTKVSFSPDSKYILSTSNDQTARLMPLFAEDVLHKINVEKVRGNVWQLSKQDKKLYGIISP